MPSRSGNYSVGSAPAATKRAHCLSFHRRPRLVPRRMGSKFRSGSNQHPHCNQMFVHASQRSPHRSYGDGFPRSWGGGRMTTSYSNTPPLPEELYRYGLSWLFCRSFVRVCHVNSRPGLARRVIASGVVLIYLSVLGSRGSHMLLDHLGVWQLCRIIVGHFDLLDVYSSTG